MIFLESTRKIQWENNQPHLKQGNHKSPVTHFTGQPLKQDQPHEMDHGWMLRRLRTTSHETIAGA